MTNLLKETIGDITRCNQSFGTIAYIGNKAGTYRISIDKFKALADIEYDSGYGGQEIASDLIILFNDNSWLERHEYDGSEEWHYKKAPAIINAEYQEATTLKGEYSWDGLEEINNIKDD